MATNKLQWKRIAKGDRLPCQSFLRKKDGEILKLSTIGGVKVGQDCYYLPVDEVINVIKDYPVEESEDEKIRKAIYNCVKWFGFDSSFFKDISQEECLSWLEKQGEMKHQYKSRPRYVGEGELLGKKVAKIEPKFKVDDKIQYMNKTYTIKEVQENYYVLDNNMSLGFYAQDVWELVEQKPTDKVEPKFKVGDKVKSIIDGFECTIESIDETGYYGDTTNFDIQDQDGWELVEQKSAWSEEDENLLKLSIENLTELKDRFGEEYGKVGDCIVLLESIKERVQPKQELSEEEEQYLLVCKNALAKYQVSDKWDATIISRWLEDKLKSLRPQSAWKPSNEQLYTLEKATHIVGSKYKSCLNSLYSELKKLREE